VVGFSPQMIPIARGMSQLETARTVWLSYREIRAEPVISGGALRVRLTPG
jgi:hypothetical protein